MGTHPIFESDFDCLTDRSLTMVETLESWLREHIRIKSKIKRIMLAECFGTFIFCLVGNGAAYWWATGGWLAGNDSSLGPLTVPFAYGMGVAFGIYASAGVSGGHINPAVTIAFAIMGKLGKTVKDNVKMFFVYSVAQIVGAFLSCFVVYWVYNDNEADGLRSRIGQYSLISIYSIGHKEDLPVSAGLFFDQMVATWILITVIFALNDSRKVNHGGIAPFLIGVAVCVIGLSYGSNGGGINPARDFALMLAISLTSIIKLGHDVAKAVTVFFWVPIFAPLVGGVLGAILYHVFIAAHREDEEDKGEYDNNRVNPVDDNREAENQQLDAGEDC